MTKYDPRKNAEGYNDPTPYAAEKHMMAQIRGKQARVAGGYFENIISASCDYYLSRGLAKIEKTPEPMKPLGAKNRKGQFLACYTKQAQPDYGGTLKGGRSIYFEAKHTDDERIEQRRLTQEQQDDLEAHHKLGAIAFVLVSMSLTDFYRVPWPVWRDMAEIYGRKYMTHAELSRYGRLHQVPARHRVGSARKGGNNVIPFPDKKYSIIYADPPWSYSDSGCSGAAAAQYATMSINELKQLPVNPAGGGIAADDCVLFMWATYPKMQEALDLIEAWGFKYKSIAFQWIKQNRSGNGYFFGLGRWTRGNTEPCLIAIKGKPKRISAGVGQLVFSPLRRHSQKPAEVRDKIVELMGDLPRIELFAREAAPGWDVWGNEAPTPEVKDAPVDSVELAGKEETHEPDNQRDPAPQL